MLRKLLIFLIIFSIGAGFGHSYLAKNQAITSFGQIAEKNTQYVGLSPNTAFIGEVYDKIKQNYWDNISDPQLLELFKISIEKNGGPKNLAKFDNKAQLISKISEITKGMNEEQRNKFTPLVTGSVLVTLPPPGRSGLYTQKEETQLKNIVNNVNPQKDLYKDLGLSKGATSQQVADAYQKKAEELKKESSPEAQEKLKQVSYAKEVLTQTDSKQRYDQNLVEPTIFTKVINGVLILRFKKISPTSYDEFIKAFESDKNDNLSALILDLRGNIGGSIDATPYFLGLFLGRNQYAFDFYHKGEYSPFRTPTEKLSALNKFRQIIILVDNQTQSSAEMLTASLKRYHMGLVLGVPTKGWGTVERVFPLDNQFEKGAKYSLFLVHSITLRDDNQPIEGRGVEPDINIKDGDWQEKLNTYFRNQDLISAVRQLL